MNNTKTFTNVIWADLDCRDDCDGCANNMVISIEGTTEVSYDKTFADPNGECCNILRAFDGIGGHPFVHDYGMDGKVTLTQSEYDMVDKFIAEEQQYNDRLSQVMPYIGLRYMQSLHEYLEDMRCYPWYEQPEAKLRALNIWVDTVLMIDI